MKRPLLTIAICLLLGAVVNVAVAWGCAICVGPGAEHVLASEATRGNVWSVLRIERMGATFFEVSRVKDPEIDRSFGGEIRPAELEPAWANLSSASPEFRSAESERVHEARRIVAFGWPGRTVWCESRGILLIPDHDGPTPLRSLDVLPVLQSQGGYIETNLEPWPGDFRRVLPLRPIWSGFAVNTILYAAILWLLIRGPFALRRFLRLRRGLCPKCAYPMGELSVCTECGGALLPGHSLRG